MTITKNLKGMKKNFYSFAFASLLMLSANPIFAKDYYLATSGNDANNGETAETALATLNAAVAKLQAGDVLHVSGMIPVSETAAFAHLKAQPVTIKGEDKDTDGFDGQSTCRIINPNDSHVIFQNLTFQNGKLNEEDGKMGGGAIAANASNIEVDNCYFMDNATLQTMGRGGAIGMVGGSLKVSNTLFSGNISRCGGAIYMNGSTKLELYSNQFFANQALVGENQIPNQNDATDGGALWIRSVGDITVQYCQFDSNVAHRAGGAISFDSALKNLKVEGCSFTNNWNGGQNESFTFVTGNTDGINAAGRFGRGDGGAISLYVGGVKDGAILNFFSNTFAGNNSPRNGGAMNVGGNKTGIELNFVNNTIVNNTTVGGVGNSAGIYAENKTFPIRIVNTIIEGNYCEANTQFADVVFGTTETTFTSSVVGYVRKLEDNQAKYTIDSKSKLNTTPNRGNEVSIDLGSIGDIQDGCFPLPADNADVTTMGSLAEAKLLGLTVDQKGQEWTKPYIGAVQLVKGDEIPENPIYSSISKVNNDAYTGAAQTYIYNVAGQLVSKAASVNGLPQGIYVVKTVAGKTVNTRKVYVK